MAISPCETITDIYQKELKQHGNSFFPIAVYEDDLRVYEVPWHWHDEWEFVHILHGNADIRMEGTCLTVKEGCAVFMNSKALHSVKKGDARIHSAVFQPRLIGENTNQIFWQELVSPILNAASQTRYLIFDPSVAWQKESIDCFEHAWKAVAQETDDYCNDTRYWLSKLFHLLINHYHFNTVSLSEKEYIREQRIHIMLAYIEDHYTEDITLHDLAQQISLSDNAALNCFRKSLGVTPIQFIKNLRLQKASVLLQKTDKTISEIAMECGFNDFSYFGGLSKTNTI